MTKYCIDHIYFLYPAFKTEKILQVFVIFWFVVDAGIDCLENAGLEFLFKNVDIFLQAAWNDNERDILSPWLL